MESGMEQRQLGKSGPMVGEVGLGAMSFCGIFGATNVETSHRTLDACLDSGVTHLDTALIYGPYISEEVLGAYLKKNPAAKNRFSIATKGGFKVNPRGISNEAGFMRECLESSLGRLGVDHIDLYYVHRRDQSIPIEDVTGTLVRFMNEGKIGGFGFSEISPSSLERASKVHHVRAVQSEYSLWTRIPEMGMLKACERLGTAFVAFSPLARGTLSDVTLDPEKFPDEFRRVMPRFQAPNYAANLEYIFAFRKLAYDLGYTPAAVAISWLLRQSPIIIPIPGTRTSQHLAECVAGASVKLTEAEWKRVDETLPPGWAHGHRYSDEQQKGVEQYC
jgi:aryl-alcohol dehydrogenase-like predicted oxidoreductase